MNDALHPDPAEAMTVSRQEAELLEWVRGSQDDAFHLHIHRVGEEWAVTRPESNYRLGRVAALPRLGQKPVRRHRPSFPSCRTIAATRADEGGKRLGRSTRAE